MSMTCIDCPAEIAERIGNHRRCKACYRARYGLKSHAQRKARHAAGEDRYCPRCDTTKESNRFYASGSYCKICQRAYSDERKAARKTEPTIYLIGCQITGLVKIGYTASSVEKRLADLQIGSPTKLKALATYPGTRRLEKHIHAEMNAWRTHGEWFNLSAARLSKVHEMLGRKKRRRGPCHQTNAVAVELAAA